MIGRVITVILAASLILIAAPAWAQFGLMSQPPSIPPAGGVLASSAGRYVFGQISDSSKDQYMLDTLTGRLWRIGESSDVGTYLKVIPYKDEQGKASPYPADSPQAKGKEGQKN